jgi:hypothetical protein
MSNYSKTTDFAAKDALTTGNANKIVKGTEIDDEFSAIQTAVNTKADVNSPTFTGTPAAPTASAATNTTQISTTAYVTAAIAAAKLALYPVGSIYTQAAVATNPATLLGFGTWAAFGAGRVMVGLDGGNALFDTVEETGGSADSIVPSHTHTASSAVTDPSHAHLFPEPFYGQGTVGNNGQGGFDGGYDAEYISTTSTAVTGITVATTVSTEGVSATDTNYQPYITVYMWKRTA